MIRRLSQKNKLVSPEIEYQEASLEPEETQQRMDRAFAILFEEVIRRREKSKKKLSPVQKAHYVQLGI